MGDPAATKEIELKLLAAPADLDRLEVRLEKSALAFTSHSAERLESRYFDTPDRRLAARGVALRVRARGDRFIQTLKTSEAGGGAHSERGEWECDVDGMVPDLGQVTDPLALEQLGLVLPEELEPVFTTTVERRLMLVEQKVPGAAPALVEVAFDRGRVTAGAADAGASEPASEPISEVELELKSGDARGLYHLLRQLRNWAPLTVGVAAKAERGYRLATGAPPPAVRAVKTRLTPEMSVGDALAAILENCLGQWLRNIPAARDGRDIEGVHQLRIAVRRARSALALFRAAVGKANQKAWDERLKTLLAATGPVRTLDVFQAETMPPLQAMAPPEAAPGLGMLESDARTARARAQAAATAFLDGRDHADLVLDFALWVALASWRETAPPECRSVLATPVVDLARALLDKRHKAVKKLGRHFAQLSDDERHEVRLALKKLRYGVEFLGGLFPGKAARRYAKAAAGLQDVLGAMNDQAECRLILQELSAEVPETSGQRGDLERGVGFVLGVQVSGMAAQRAAATAAWEAFVAERPFWRDGDGR